MTQQQAAKILKQGNNVYLTGPAGSGKTFLLNSFIKYLYKNNIGVAITASTGIAATHLGGITIHSWAGIGINDDLNKAQLNKLLRKQRLRKRFKETKVLIIDEVSMLHAHTLDLVDKVCRAFKDNDLSFGGIQVVLCGDFFQLPPVSKNDEEACFIHKSKVWQNMDLSICYLDEQYRQADDQFAQILNAIREDKVTEEIKDILTTRFRKEVPMHIRPTKLYTHNMDVDSINDNELARIPGSSKAYNMRFTGPKALVEGLQKSCLAPQRLILKKGAIVMFVKNNFTKGYVNGTLGQVIDFDEGFPIVETVKRNKIFVEPEEWKVEENDITRAKIKQMPLRLAWAITVHKSQGMSLDAAEIDLSKSFTYGMGYVALSRVRTLAGIKLMGMNDMALCVDENVLELDFEFKKASLFNNSKIKN